MISISSLRHVNLDSYVIVGQLTGYLVAVAKSNPGLEAIVVLEENLQMVTLFKGKHSEQDLLIADLFT